jgi:hypothetical protein
MKNRVKKQNKKGETMGIRKFISLLLLVAFTLQLAPANAAIYSSGGATLPTIVQDPGTKANGANREVVPVTIKVDNISPGELLFTRASLTDGAGVSSVAASITANGKLAFTAFNGSASVASISQRMFVLQPPTGSQFVGLNIDGYTSSLTSSVITNGSSATPQYVNVSGVGTSDTVLPGGTGDAGANFILAGVLTENGPASYFGSIVPKGSIVVHPVTFAAVAETHTGPLVALNLTNFGLVADPSGNTTLSGSLTASNFTPTGSSPATTGSLTLTNTGLTVATATTAPAGGKLETAKLAAEDSQPNVVLASRLASGSSTIKIGPGLITSTGTGLTTLNVDTDAIIIRARERAESTASAKAYYQTPFATSAFVPGQTLSANGATSIAVLNTALTNATKFPNTDNARITVTFKAVNPTTGADSDATLVVNAVNVSLYGDKALDEVRDVTGNETTSAALEGWLGALSLGTNGSAAATNYGLGVIYNGTSAASALVVKDATPADYSVQTATVGIVAATANTSVPTPNANAPTAIANGTTSVGIFPGSLVTDINNGNNASAWNIVTVANGSGATPFSFAVEGGSFAAAVNNGAAIYTPGEVSARLVSGAANAWFTILGHEASTNIGNGRDLTVGATNISAVAPTKAPVLNASLGVRNAANNAVVVANLTDKVLTILPLTNRYDGLRDALSVRPEMTLTLGTNSRTQGVKIVAVISGGNIGTSEEVVVAEVLAAGSLSTSFTLQTLPTSGNLTGLMAENGTNPSTGRASIALSDVTGASATTDSISDLVSALGTNRALDTTVPPLFCGGTAGTGKFGPNKVIFQPKARTVLVTESAADQFKAISDLNTARLRITLPAGWDLNAYNGSLAASQIVGLITTGGSTFTVAPSIVRIQPRNVNAGSTGTDAAFIDINVGTPGTTTQAVLRSIGLVFKPNALVAPAGSTDFNATVTVVDAGAANTRGASIADDTVLSTVGTVSLASACSTFLAVSYCPSAISSYQDTSAITSGLTQAEVLANGASLTSFSGTVGGAVRYVGNGSTISLPDICISEGTADAFPIGGVTDGVPTQFGEVAMGATAGTGVLHLASSFDGSDDAGLAATGSSRSVVSDNSITAGNPSGSANDVSVSLSVGAGTTRPFAATSSVRLRGLTMDGSTGTLPAAQDFIAWFEAVTATSDEYVIGNSVAKSVFADTVNGSSYISAETLGSTDEEEKMAANYRNGDVIDNVALTVTHPVLTTTADLTTYFANSSAPTIASAVVRTLDTSAIKVLTESTVLSVSVSNITGSTDKLVEVSAAAGSLQAGTLITATTTATGGTAADTVLVPVLADGSFKLTVRSTATGLITLTQGPVSAATRTPAQVTRYLEVADQNVDPAITAAVAQDIGLGTVSEKGKVPVVFQVTSTGKSGGVDFVPTASQLTLGGAPVTAVTGSTNKFIGLVDFAKSNALTVVCTVGSEVSTVELTELDSQAATKLGAPTLTGVRNNTAGFIVLKGQRLRNGQTFGFVLNDGTFQAVTLRNQTKNEAKTLNRRSAAAETIPANAAYAVFSVPDRGVASKAIVTE